MGIQFAPHDGIPILLEASSQPRKRKCPSGWWILPAIVLGCVEVIAIIGWIVV